MKSVLWVLPHRWWILDLAKVVRGQNMSQDYTPLGIRNPPTNMDNSITKRWGHWLKGREFCKEWKIGKWNKDSSFWIYVIHTVSSWIRIRLPLSNGDSIKQGRAPRTGVIKPCSDSSWIMALDGFIVYSVSGLVVRTWTQSSRRSVPVTVDTLIYLFVVYLMMLSQQLQLYNFE
jgi:hypothetical protein